MICRLLTVFDTVTGRGGGIRTPGALQLNGFQDRRIRPLCHSSFPHKSRKFRGPEFSGVQM
jgi:hypothetical protein